eukprot:m.157059 g.157059  ORF g.157059 m.157059 type:complete len:75 (+) comp38697_c0_seq10:94-318(+)
MVTFTSAFSAEMVCAEIVNPNATSCSLTAADFQMLGLGLGNFELNDLQNYAVLNRRILPVATVHLSIDLSTPIR